MKVWQHKRFPEDIRFFALPKNEREQYTPVRVLPEAVVEQVTERVKWVCGLLEAVIEHPTYGVGREVASEAIGKARTALTALRAETGGDSDNGREHTYCIECGGTGVRRAHDGERVGEDGIARPIIDEWPCRTCGGTGKE